MVTDSQTHDEPAAGRAATADGSGALVAPARGRTYGGLTAEERLAERRRRLLDVGLRLFAERGFSRTGVRELCRAARIGERAFYDTVGSREALLRDVYLEATDAVLADIAAALEHAPTDFVPRLQAGLAAFFASITDDPRRGRLIYVESLGRGPEIEETRREGLGRFVAFVIERLGEYLPDPPPHAAAIDAAVSAVILGIGEVAFRLAEGEPGFTAAEATQQITQAVAGAGLALGLRP